MENSGHQRRVLRRGVRASRRKLDRALADSGLRTQAALAARLADLEDLESLPKDLVNRVFREKPVDPQTLERVARALGVEAYTLYRSSADAAASGTEAKPQPESPRAHARAVAQPRPWMLAAGVIVASLAVGVLLSLVERPGEARSAQRTPATRHIVPAAGASVAVLPLAAEPDGRFSGAIRSALSPSFRVYSDGVGLATSGLSAPEALDALKVDYVIGGEILPGARFSGVLVYIFEPGARELLWSQVIAQWAGPESAARLAETVSHRLAAPQLPPPPPRAAIQHYLRGRGHLDKSRTELNVKRALARFEAALHIAPDFVEARAGVCESMAEEVLLGAERELLDLAERQCTRAVDSDPANAVALAALGKVLLLKGDAEAAQARLAVALEHAPRNVDALLSMAETRMSLYRTSGGTNAGLTAEAVALARSATEIQPDFWKAYFTLSRMHYYRGELEQAISVLEQAEALDPNELVLGNLGTMHFCAGNHARARDYYLEAGKLTGSFWGTEANLGAVSYFLRDYEQAAAHFTRAIELQQQDGSAEDHRLWGNLADARRYLGDSPGAIAAYEHAARLAEAEHAADASPNTRAFLAFYYAALAKLDPERVPDTVRRASAEELVELQSAATDPEALIRVAEAWALEGRADDARAAMALGAAHCVGFAGSPDLASVRTAARDADAAGQAGL